MTLFDPIKRLFRRSENRDALALSPPPSPDGASRRSLTGIVETRAFRGLLDVLWAMPEADELIQREGADIYDRMRTDDAVFAAEFQLMTRILGRPWDVHPPEHLKGDDFAGEVATYVKGVLSAMNTEEMLEHLARALRHKHAGGQLVYADRDGALAPERFVAERRDIFRFGPRGECLLNLDGLSKEPDPFKWAIHVNEPEPSRYGGRSIFSRVYWPWKFKRSAGWPLWVKALDHFAVPSLAALFELAEFDRTTAKEIAEDIAGELVNIASGSVGALAQTKQLAQIGGAKAVEGFDTFLEMCDRAIYRGLLTVTLTISEGRQGAERGSSLVHDEAADQVAAYYARHLAQSVSMQTAAYAALLRFGEAARPVLPRFAFDFDEPISLEKLIELMDRRFPISRRALYARYGVPEPSDASDAFVMDGGASDAGGDGAAALPSADSGPMATLSVPKEDEEEVRARLFTYFRNKAIKERFRAARAEGATVEEALALLAPAFELSRERVRSIVYRK